MKLQDQQIALLQEASDRNDTRCERLYERLYENIIITWNEKHHHTNTLHNSQTSHFIIINLQSDYNLVMML